MQPAEIPTNEQERLKALQTYKILDTLPEKDFDDITRIASEICQTPISLITLIDEQRQWFKSRQGLDVSETPRKDAFCAHAILQPDEIMIVPNPREDERFYANPLVTGEPRIMFYAGVPLITPEGYPLGTLCVIDKKSRQLTPQQIDSLKALANQVVAQLELRRKVEELHKSQTALQEANQALESFAYNAAHDLKNPLNNVISLIGLLNRHLPEDTSEKVRHFVQLLETSAYGLKDMIESLLKFSRVLEISTQEKERVNVQQLMDEIVSRITLPPHCTFSYSDLPTQMITSRTALQHILSNLCTNAVKYNDKERGHVQVAVTEEATHYLFQVTDNGSGIPKKDFTTIFEMFSTLNHKDRFGRSGTGLGLFIVKKLVEKLGGTIQVRSQLQEGTTFEFTLPKEVDEADH